MEDIENYCLKVGKLYKGKSSEYLTAFNDRPTIVYLQTKTGWERVYAGAIIMVLSAKVVDISGCTAMTAEHEVLYGDIIGRLRLADEDDFLSWTEVNSE